jgi:hypothetical protein
MPYNSKLSTEIKAGDIIKFGNVWGKVISAPTQSPYNRNEVEVQVIQLSSVIRRKGAYKSEEVAEISTSFSYRKTTFVKVK